MRNSFWDWKCNIRGCVQLLECRTFVSICVVLVFIPTKLFGVCLIRKEAPPLYHDLTWGLVCHERHSHRPNRAECHGSLDWMVDQHVILVRALDPARGWMIS